jgi:hypothetical protein
MRDLEICRIFRRQSSQYAIMACSSRNVSTICAGDTGNIVALRSPGAAGGMGCVRREVATGPSASRLGLRRLRSPRRR